MNTNALMDTNAFYLSQELEQVLLNKQSGPLILHNVIARGTQVSDKEQKHMQDCRRLSALTCDVMDRLSLECDPRHSHDLAGSQITEKHLCEFI